MAEPNFWDDSARSNKLMKELKYLKGCIEPFENNFKKIKELKELTEISESDEDLLKQIQEELNSLNTEIDAFGRLSRRDRCLR